MSRSTIAMTTWSPSPWTLISPSITMEEEACHRNINNLSRYSSFSNSSNNSCKTDICQHGVWQVCHNHPLRWVCTLLYQESRWMTEIDILQRFRWLPKNRWKCLRGLRSRNRIRVSLPKTNWFISTWMWSLLTVSTMDIPALWEVQTARSTHLARWSVSSSYMTLKLELVFKRS